VIVALISIKLTARQKRRDGDRAERQRLNATYLNPLRFQIADNHYRLWDFYDGRWFVTGCW
jgi:hypothetical protein